MKRLLSSSATFMLFMIVILSGMASAMEIGQIKTLQGEVVLIQGNTQSPAKLGDVLHQADVVETGDNSSVGITFIDNSRFAVGPNTRIELRQFRFNPTTHDGEFITDMPRGTLTVISGDIAKQSPEAMKIKTPSTILGFRGTKTAILVTE